MEIPPLNWLGGDLRRLNGDSTTLLYEYVSKYYSGSENRQKRREIWQEEERNAFASGFFAIIPFLSPYKLFFQQRHRVCYPSPIPKGVTPDGMGWLVILALLREVENSSVADPLLGKEGGGEAE